MTQQVTVIGGGLAGLTAAIACAETGAKVRLSEAHSQLGGRGRATSPPHVAHDGAHVFYADGPHYRWLKQRGFVAGLGLPGPAEGLRVRFRVDAALRRVPPVALLRAQAAAWRRAPVDTDFHTWATGIWGERTARCAANAIAVTTYDADTGRLSAAFVWNLFQRVLGPRIPAVRWVRGGWQLVIDRMAARAAQLGVVIETGVRAHELASDGPTIVATELNAARTLLGDDSLRWTSGAAALLDVAVPFDRGNRSVVLDLDEGGFHECYTMQDHTIAPAGESLFQLQLPLREGETPAAARSRLEAFADQTIPGWRDHATFSRHATARGRTGALDLPGQTWRDRPAIDRGGDVYLVGDMVAAPGMRGEISINSALAAAAAATRQPVARPTPEVQASWL